MLQTRAIRMSVAIIIPLIGIAAIRLATGMSATQIIIAQAPPIGPTNTAAAETAAAGVTAISATDAPPTPTAPPTLTPIPSPTSLPPTTATSTPRAVTPAFGSATTRGTPAVVAPTSGTGDSGAWPVVGVFVAIAAVGAIGTILARNARRQSPGK